MDPAQRLPLVLASASPRRREILAQLGLAFRVEESGVAEPEPAEGVAPESHARALAALKAEAVAERVAPDPALPFVLGADTLVVVRGRILGKPADDGDAVRMLMVLAGRSHEVITAVALRRADGGHASGVSVKTRVAFRAFDVDTARRYVATGEGRDKAGAYAAQGIGAGLVRAVEGSYSNVVGLPAVETIELLSAAGVLERWP
jgi:septum formation protein